MRKLDGILGSSGYEGIKLDKNGNLIIIEDAGGTSVNVVKDDPNSPKNARQPNSFVYLFTPNDKTDLSKGGQLYAIQVLIDRQPVTFHANDALGDTFSDAQLKLHTLGTKYPFKWVLVHDTNTDGTTPFNANAPEFGDVARKLATADTLDGFLRDIRAKFPETTAPAATAPQPAAPNASGPRAAVAADKAS